jgi:predicted nucleic acid-binding protein
MMKKAEYRDKMADILNELPLTIQECEDYAQIYPGKNTMRLRIEELYIQLVGAIEDMIRWYTQKSLSRVTKSLLKTDAYADAIDNRIKAIKGSQDAFDKETRKYLHWRTELIDRTTVETHMVVQVINEDVVRIGQKVWESSHRIEDIESAVKSQTEVFNGVTDVLRDVCKKAEWLQDRKTYQQKVVDQNTRIQELEMQLQKKTFRVKTLAKRLNLAMPDDCYWPDLDVALAAGATCSLRYQGQARHIAEAEEFQGWFQSRESAVLCINGNFEQHSLSPTAYLGALLIQNSDIDNVLVLRFFCGLHTSPTTAGDHELEGPFLLIRSLLAQALGAGGIDEKQRLSFLNEDDAQAMEDASFSHYLGTFIKLVKGLLQDYHGIIVIIDGIEYYDYEGRKKLKKVIKALLKTTGKSSLVGYLKVLIMASSYSKVFGDVDDVQILDMPNDIERIGSGFDSLAELN